MCFTCSQPQTPANTPAFAAASRDLVNAFEDHQRAAATLGRLHAVGAFVDGNAANADWTGGGALTTPITD